MTAFIQQRRDWRCGCGGGHLTTREIEVLLLAAVGLHSHEIASKLGISIRTVDDHFAEMQRRAGASNRCDLIARCYGFKIIYDWPPCWSGKHCLPRPGQAAHVHAVDDMKIRADANRLSERTKDWLPKARPAPLI